MLENVPLDAAPKAVYTGRRDILDTLDNDDGRSPTPEQVTYDLTASSTAVLIALHKIIQNDHFVPSPLQGRVVFLLYLERLRDEIVDDIDAGCPTDQGLLDTVDRLMSLSASFMRRHLHDVEPLKSAMHRPSKLNTLLDRLERFIVRYRDLKVTPRIKEEETAISKNAGAGAFSPRPAPGASIAWFTAVAQSATASDLEVLLGRFMRRNPSPEVVLGLRETSYRTSLLATRSRVTVRTGEVDPPAPVSVPKAVSSAVNSLSDRASRSGIPFRPAIDHNSKPDTVTGRRRVVANASIEPVLENGETQPPVVRRKRTTQSLGIAGAAVPPTRERPLRNARRPNTTYDPRMTATESRERKRPVPPRTAPGAGQAGQGRGSLALDLSKVPRGEHGNGQTSSGSPRDRDPFAWCGAFRSDYDSPRGVYRAPPTGMLSHGRPRQRGSASSTAAMVREQREQREREQREEGRTGSVSARSTPAPTAGASRLSGVPGAGARRARDHHQRRPATTATGTRLGRTQEQLRGGGGRRRDDVDDDDDAGIEDRRRSARDPRSRPGSKSVRFRSTEGDLDAPRAELGLKQRPATRGAPGEMGFGKSAGDYRRNQSARASEGAHWRSVHEVDDGYSDYSNYPYDSRPSTAASAMSKTARFIHELEMTDWARTTINQIRQARSQSAKTTDTRDTDPTDSLHHHDDDDDDGGGGGGGVNLPPID